MAKRPNKTRRLPDVQQALLLDIAPASAPVASELPGVPSGVRFERGDRGRLFVGAVPLEKYLHDGGLKWVLRLTGVFESLSWKEFEASYKPGGRPPLHPSRVVGLIMYGLLLKQTSLRQLEALALRDVGAWWITGGLTPDFTTVTKFIQRHVELLTEDFFREMTALIARRLNLTLGGEAGIDGTVVQAAASTGSALTREALDEELKLARQAEDAERVAKLERASAVLADKERAREESGRTGKPQVSPEDPEAVLQPKKNSDDYQLAMKPVIAADPSGLIVAQTVSPQSETEAVPKLLEQYQQICGAQPQRVLADAGFSSIAMLMLFLNKGIEPLVPSGKGTAERAGPNDLYAKSAFIWDEEAASFRCPAQKLMVAGKTVLRDKAGRAYRNFEGSRCEACPLRPLCTSGKRRHIKRYEGDELKDAMAKVLAQPAAQGAYRRRSAIVEPAFARLREGGLSRFRRRGTRGARLEFALACVAHNLRLFLWSRRGVLVVLAVTMLPDASWRPVALALAIHDE